MEQKHFFTFLQFALGNATLGEEDAQWVGKADWQQLLAFAQRHAIVGVYFEGIKKLPKHLMPTGEDMYNWVEQAQTIEWLNRRLNVATADVYRQVTELGVECCILKGQGNSLLYSNPFSRNPGDVDVWINRSRKALYDIALRLVDGKTAKLDVNFYHINFKINGVVVELHAVPSVMANPFVNRRLSRWLGANAASQFRNVVELPAPSGSVAVPTHDFNMVYQLCHLYHHYFYEGIGLRQFVDYFLLLKSMSGISAAADSQSSVSEKRYEELHRLLSSLGIYHFAGAVMYVLHEVFGLCEDEMFVPMDKRRGEQLMADIMKGGNFGKFDHTFAKSGLGHNLQRLVRSMRNLRYYPMESVSEPFFRLWHFFWRKSRKR